MADILDPAGICCSHQGLGFFLSGLGTCGHHCGPACGELRFPCKASRLDNVQDFCRQGLGVWGLGVLEVRGLGVYGLRGWGLRV